jgi:hypothetical protein
MNKIRISGNHYNSLRAHLFPGDNKEAVAIALCGRSNYNNNRTLLVQELFVVPYDKCTVREHDQVTWLTDIINPFLEKASKRGLAIVKIHCHPGWYEQFSDIDNHSDNTLFKSIHAWLDDGLPHASCIMLPDGRIFGRFFCEGMKIEIVDQIAVAGSTILDWRYDEERPFQEDLQIRNLQAFGKKTMQILSKQKIAVIGCSGTGSPTIEQLKRYGVGTLVLADPDYVDFLNLNRIIGSTWEDAKNKHLKTHVLERGINETGFETKVINFPDYISSIDIVKELADCDMLFSCVDGAEARHILNMISTFYLIPLIDMGVKLVAEQDGGIKSIYGSIHFIQPGGSSLYSRGQYDLERVRSEAIRRSNSEEAARNQYLVNVNETSPAVISINMQVAATAVNEFLARLHPYRNVDNKDIDIVRIMFGECATYGESQPDPCLFFCKYIGKGDIEPLLNNPELSHVKKVA